MASDPLLTKLASESHKRMEKEECLKQKKLLEEFPPKTPKEKAREKASQAKLATIFKIIVFLIFLYLAAYWVANNSNVLTKEECLNYAKNAEERYYCEFGTY